MSELTISLVKRATDTETRDVKLHEVLGAIRGGGKTLSAQVEQIRSRFNTELKKSSDLETAKRAIEPLKKALPAIMPCGRFSNRVKPVAEKLQKHSGFLTGDFDDLGTRLPEVRKKLETSPYVFAVFLSPSGNGLKAMFRVPADAAKHAGSFRAVEKHVLELTGIQIDESCKDISRLCFMSFDRHLYVNSNAVEITPLPEPEKPRPSVNSSPGRDSKPSKEQVREMLAVIPKRPQYHDWIKLCAAVGDALDESDAIELLNEWSPEEEPGEYAQKLQSGFEKIHVGTLFHLARKHGWKPKIPWGDLQPLPEDMPAVPPFDYRCLPETLCPWIRDIAERMQCPAEFPAVGMMIALGSVLGRKIGIRPKRRDDWVEIANLWGCIIARPGLLKTPALQQALVLLRRLTAKAYERYQQEVREHEISAMLTAQRKRIVEEKIKKHLKDKKDFAAREEAEKHLGAAKEKPVCRRYEINDSTIPKLGELLAENPNGLLLVRDELSGLLRELDCEDRAGDRAKYLEMWDGKGEFTYDRIERGTVRVPSNTLSILGGIQPDVTSPYVREAVRGGTGNDGLLQRLQLFVWPDVSKEWHNVDEWPDTEAKQQAYAVFEYLDQLSVQDVGADTSDEIPFLRFTADAQACFDAWREPLEKRLRSGIEHPAFEAHLSKYRKLVPALALLIHLAERKNGPVSLDALSKALLWADYLEAHARRIYSAVLRPDSAAARELAKHLLRHDLPARFNLREVYRRGWAGLTEKEDAEAAAEILCDLGWIRPFADAPRRLPGTPGRAPSPIFETNPKILEVPWRGTATTDTIISDGSVSDPQGAPETSELPVSAADPENLRPPLSPTDTTDTNPEEKVGWV
jgi:putative DNA primase/helicase